MAQLIQMQSTPLGFARYHPFVQILNSTHFRQSYLPNSSVGRVDSSPDSVPLYLGELGICMITAPMNVQNLDKIPKP